MVQNPAWIPVNVFYLLAAIIIALVANGSNFRRVIFDIAGYGFIIETGIGIGFELSFLIRNFVKIE